MRPLQPFGRPPAKPVRGLFTATNVLRAAWVWNAVAAAKPATAPRKGRR